MVHQRLGGEPPGFHAPAARKKEISARPRISQVYDHKKLCSWNMHSTFFYLMCLSSFFCCHNAFSLPGVHVVHPRHVPILNLLLKLKIPIYIFFIIPPKRLFQKLLFQTQLFNLSILMNSLVLFTLYRITQRTIFNLNSIRFVNNKFRACVSFHVEARDCAALLVQRVVAPEVEN